MIFTKDKTSSGVVNENSKKNTSKKIWACNENKITGPGPKNFTLASTNSQTLKSVTTNSPKKELSRKPFPHLEVKIKSTSSMHKKTAKEVSQEFQEFANRDSKCTGEKPLEKYKTSVDLKKRNEPKRSEVLDVAEKMCEETIASHLIRFRGIDLENLTPLEKQKLLNYLRVKKNLEDDIIKNLPLKEGNGDSKKRSPKREGNKAVGNANELTLTKPSNAKISIHNEQTPMEKEDFPQKKLINGEKPAEEIKNNASSTQYKRLKPSEIPLRKDRPDLLKKLRPVYLLKNNSLNDIESNKPTDIFRKKPEFSTIDGLNMNSESQENEKPKEKKEPRDAEVFKFPKKKVEVSLKEETRAEKKAEGDCIDVSRLKAPNISVLSESPSNILMYKQCKSAGSKSKFLNLDEMEISFFNLLKTKSNTLHRLESLHQQNLCSKESNLSDKGTTTKPSKMKIFTTNSSFNLKKKSSQKNLAVLPKKKGSSLNLKNKEQKIKNVYEENCTRKNNLEAQESLSRNFRSIKKFSASDKMNYVPNAHLKSVKGEDEKSKLKSNFMGDTLEEKQNSDNNLSKFNSKLQKISKPKTPNVSSKISRKNSSMENLKSPSEFLKRQNTNLENFNDFCSAGLTNGKTTDVLHKTLLGKENTEGKISSTTTTENFLPTTPPPTPEDSSTIVGEALISIADVQVPPPSKEYSSGDFPSFPITISTYTQPKTPDCGRYIGVEPLKQRKDPPKTKPERKIKPKETKKPATEVKTNKDTKEELTLENLILKGTSIRLIKSLSREIPVSGKVSLEINLALSNEENFTLIEKENPVSEETEQDFNWLFKNSRNTNEVLETPSANCVETKIQNEGNGQNTFDSGSDEISETESKTFAIEKVQNSNEIQKEPKLKTSATDLNESLRNKKIRSDFGDRQIFPSNGHFNAAISFSNKINKPDAKFRRSLTKSHNREMKISLSQMDKNDVFGDLAAVKLKRRNSEPASFRDFIWKRADVATPRANKASVSSMASSLRHLNTDDLEDFIFWETVPQKMTSCWEMSLYHLKRPWSVLSCSVFQDNRHSTTPGLILTKLKNGGSHNNRRALIGENETVSRKENSFDVEPSIAQKNIDIRNWLAALNFPTIPSTSSDMANQRRRKLLPGLKFSEEIIKTKPEDKKKYQEAKKLDFSEVGGLMELIRRKSGGFVTAEQFLLSEIPAQPQNVTIAFCAYNKLSEEKSVFEKIDDKNVISQPKIREEEKSVVQVEQQVDDDQKQKTNELFSRQEMNTKMQSCQELAQTITDVSDPTEQEKTLENETETCEAQFKGCLAGELATMTAYKYLIIGTFIIMIMYGFFLANKAFQIQ